MAVGREHEPNVQSLAGSVGLCLIKTVTGRQRFSLGLDERHRYRLGIDIDLDPEDIVYLAPRAPPSLAVDYLNSARRLFAPNKILGPASFVNSRINQFGSRISFVVTH